MGGVFMSYTIKKGEFFSVDIEVIKSIVKSGGGAEDVMGYLILSRHTNSRAKSPYTTAGANAVANKAGITNRHAEKVLSWLSLSESISGQIRQFIFHRLDYIEMTHEEIPEYLGAGKNSRTKVRWVLGESPEPTLLYLANGLVDGIGKGKENPPLARIISQTQMGKNINIHKARLDSIMLLLNMYLYHELGSCGGVDPRVGFYRSWENEEQNEDIYYDDLPYKAQDIGGSNEIMFTAFSEKSLFYISDNDERNKRFWHAFKNLKKLAFIYEVLQIWDDDPHKNERAEPLYPLYVFDRHARKAEPYLAKVIHRTIINIGAFSDVENFFDSLRDIRGSNKYLFRYAVPQDGGFPLSVFRLRFRAKTRDNFIGMEQEIRRADYWKSLLESEFVDNNEHCITDEEAELMGF